MAAMTFPTVEDLQRQYPRMVKVGKVTGTLRLYGKARDFLREFVFDRAQGMCQECFHYVTLEKGLWTSMHLAHIKSVGSGGADTPDNTRCLCISCHMREHAKGSVKTPQVTPNGQ